jgi:hypothetical protein
MLFIFKKTDLLTGHGKYRDQQQSADQQPGKHDFIAAQGNIAGHNTVCAKHQQRGEVFDI